MVRSVEAKRDEAATRSAARTAQCLSAIRADRRGAVALLAAIFVSALLFFAGLTIDFGLVLFKKRELQAATDLAALAASQNIAKASSIVSDMMAANGFASAHVLSLTPGYYDTTRPVGSRFVPGQAPLDALMLSTSFDVPLSFVRAIVPNATLSVPAVAATAQFGEAGLVAGSGLAALTNSGLPNAILGKMLGTTVSLDLVSYNGLANAQIDALDFLDALATQLSLTGGTYGQVLSGSASMGAILNAEIAALGKPGALGQTQVAIAGLQTLAGELNGAPMVSLGTLFSAGIWQNAKIGTIDRNTALQAAVNVYQVTTFAAQIANGSNFVNAGTSLTVPPPPLAPLATVTVATTAIEPPQGSYFSIGPAGTTVHTSQVRLQLIFNLTTQLLIPLLSPVAVTLPVYVEVASGTASITSIACGGSPGADARVGVSAVSGVGSAFVGTVTPNAMTNFNQPVTVSPATLVNALNILTVTGSSNVAVTGNTVPLVFTQSQIDAQQSQRISSTNMTSNLLATLQSTLKLTVSPSLLQLTVPALLTPLLTPVFAILDTVTDQVLSTLGVQVGYLDVTVTGDRCGVPALIQ